jgi:hypothetical protein
LPLISQPPSTFFAVVPKGARPGRRRRALAEGLRVELAFIDDAREVDLAPRRVFGALLVAHGDAVGQHAGPHGAADVHVPGQRGGSAEAPDLGRDHHVGREVGARAAELGGHAEPEEALLAQVVVVGEREARLLVPLRGAGGEPVAAQRVGLGQPFALQRA